MSWIDDVNADLGQEVNNGVSWHRGQLRFAHLLAQQYADRLMHVHGIGWHAWDGTRWAEDDRGAAKRAVMDLLKAGWQAAISDKDMERDVKACNSAAGVGGVLDLASALTTFAHTITDLDPDPYLLNCANGTLDLRTLELRGHDPGDRITKVCNAAYDPDAPSTTWTAFLARVLPDEDVRAFLQRYIGLALCGHVAEHILAILIGGGRNGKGVFYGGVNHALGDYASEAEPDLFMHREGAHPTGEMDLRGQRFVVVSESEKGRKLAEATVKRLTGGDRIRARRMRQDFVSFTPSHTPALVTNDLPKVRGDDPALWARLRVIPFEVTIPPEEQDKNLDEKLQLEASAVLSWAVAGWQDYQRQGLAEPAAVVRATDAYHTDSDAIARFIEECCITGDFYTAAVSELWERWCHWRAEDGAEEMSKKDFGIALDERGFEVHRGQGGRRIRRGIGLQAEDEEAC